MSENLAHLEPNKFDDLLVFNDMFHCEIIGIEGTCHEYIIGFMGLLYD